MRKIKSTGKRIRSGVGRLTRQHGKRPVAGSMSTLRRKYLSTGTMHTGNRARDADMQRISGTGTQPQPTQQQQQQQQQGRQQQERQEQQEQQPKVQYPKAGPTTPTRKMSETKTHPVSLSVRSTKFASASPRPGDPVIMDIQPEETPAKDFVKLDISPEETREVKRPMSGRTVHLLNQAALEAADGDSSDDDDASVADSDTYSEVRLLHKQLKSQQITIDAMQSKLKRVSRRQVCVMVGLLLVIASVIGLMAAVVIIAEHTDLV